MAPQIVACQTDIAWEDKRSNFTRVRSLLETADVQPGALVILPEMFATGFSMDVGQIAEARDGNTAAFLAELARQRQCYVLGGVVTQAANGLGRNEAVVFDPSGRETVRYCKMHPFSFGGEAGHYERGAGPALFAWEGFQVAPLICYDLRFPEVFRHLIVDGAQLFIITANWPQERDSHWRVLLRARAIENQAYVVGVNRVGRDPHHDYAGQSVIFDPRGEIVAAVDDSQTVLTAMLDLPSLLEYRKQFPVLADMRKDW